MHAESDYKAPLFVGDIIEIEVTMGKVGTTSFTFKYNIYNAAKETIGTAKTVHVTMDKKTKTKIPLPPLLKEKVTSLLNKNS